MCSCLEPSCSGEFKWNGVCVPPNPGMESMRKLRLRNPPLLAILINGVLLSRTLAWDPDMPGGMKLVIDGDTFSFTTDTCSGGVFFKRPVFIQLTCFHGYYLTRPNGCSMENNQIIGGQNYVCQEVNKDKTKKIQAFIPVTNPDNPLAHTISFFDEPGMLKNLRRLAYVEGLEGAYDNLNLLSAPVGAIVTTPDKTPRVTIARTCYQGKSQRSASAYLVSLPGGQQDAPRNKMFTLGCADGAVDFPWNTESVHNFTEGLYEEKLTLR
ncbi:unnamed protein product [Allacma fusca]|uniref:Uncharacterized protein n=1 Tax=Allacma fusca TaxID=39272 RepID=A0A8J2LLZ3_9HEXA|nr:unnamed protein product [Allacma fusca]